MLYKQMGEGEPAQPLDVRQAMRVIAEKTQCPEYGHELRVNHDGDAVCQNGCGKVFSVKFSHTKELRA